MSNNDAKIKTLLSTIETKRANLGTKPKAVWKTNGVLKFNDGTHMNINAVTHTDRCVEAVAYLLGQQSFVKEAQKLLGVEYESLAIDDYLQDFKLRASILKWESEKRKLEVLENKLKDLRSEDAKTSDAISDIISELDV